MTTIETFVNLVRAMREAQIQTTRNMHSRSAEVSAKNLERQVDAYLLAHMNAQQITLPLKDPPPAVPKNQLPLTGVDE